MVADEGDEGGFLSAGFGRFGGFFPVAGFFLVTVFIIIIIVVVVVVVSELSGEVSTGFLFTVAAFGVI